MRKNNKKKGFTIVELVIVIAVIAILAAVLIPTFSNVVSNANKTAAMENARNEWTAYLATIAAEGTIGDFVITSKVNDSVTYVYVVEDNQLNTNGYLVGSVTAGTTGLTLKDSESTANTWTLTWSDNTKTLKKDDSNSITISASSSEDVVIYAIDYTKKSATDTASSN